MPPPPRNPPPQPLQRLVMLTTVLSAAGDTGRPALVLAEWLGFGGTDESKRESLAREIRKLRSVGIEIVNVADRGSEARWVLRPHDSRIQLAFDPEQRAQLARAALLAGRTAVAAELADDRTAATEPGLHVGSGTEPPALDRVLRAVSARCELRFEYNGRPRVLDPATLHRDSGGWSVTGHERGAGADRTFYVSRMSDTRLGPPGSAAGARSMRLAGLDPLLWEVDPPLTATLHGDQRYAPDVARLLGLAASAPEADGTVTYVATVTNRWLFLARVIELGERVVLGGPPELRAELRERLQAAIGTAP